MKYYHLTIIILVLLFSCGNTKKEIKEDLNEISVYNDLLDTLYSIKFCHFSMIHPEHLPVKPSKDYIEKYNAALAKFKADLDSTQLRVYVYDSLYQLDLKTNKEFLLERLDSKDSLYKKLIVNNTKSLASRLFHVDSLAQKGILFKNMREVKDEFKYGQVDDGLNIGVASFSRICFNKSYDTGICYFTYIGSPKCGYGKYLLIKKEDEKWVLHKSIKDVVY